MRRLSLFLLVFLLLQSGPEAMNGAQPLPATESSEAAGLPAALQPMARKAKEQFERANALAEEARAAYTTAEMMCRQILEKAPNDLYTLSNLGVVLFRAGKNEQAEETLKKAIAVAPKDGFSHCVLGIVYYTETKDDDAINELTKALAINRSNATAHYYLGLTASRKGWKKVAEKELETAKELEPNLKGTF